jgi:hypothetical protein
LIDVAGTTTGRISPRFRESELLYRAICNFLADVQCCGKFAVVSPPTREIPNANLSELNGFGCEFVHILSVPCRQICRRLAESGDRHVAADVVRKRLMTMGPEEIA